MTKTKIGEANVTNGVANTSYTIPGDAATGQHTLTAAFIQNNTHKRGEGSTTLAIRIRTTITVDNVIASHGETATFTAKCTHTGTQNIPQNAGQVQFQLGGDNIGSPVTVGANGIATLQYTIPSSVADDTDITASFIQNDTYAGSNSTAAKLNIRQSTNIVIDSLYANRGDTTTIQAVVSDANNNPVANGNAIIYLDNTQIATTTVTNGAIEEEYTLSSNIATGQHTIRIEYQQNDTYDAATSTGTLQIRIPTHLTPVNVSGNAETPNDVVPVTVTVQDENNNTVQSGSVAITIGSEQEVIIAVNANGEATTQYTIPSTATGSITFNARYIQDNNYQSSNMATSGVITIRKGTIITMESINAVRGDNITLTANVKDTDNNNVNSGTVEFELE